MWTDTVGFSAAAGSTIYARLFNRVPAPATSASASAVTGGALTASTTYYYKLTTLDNGVEAGVSSEVSATTGSSGTLAISLSWTAPSYGNAINIYRSTTTGTEKFLAQVPIGQTSFVDLGYSTSNSAVAVPSATTTPISRFMRTGESGNPQAAGGNGSNVTQATGAISGSTGPNTVYFPVPLAIICDDYANPSIIDIGDSIDEGVGIYKYAAGPYMQSLGNIFDGAITAGQFAGTMNLSIAASRLDAILNGTENAQLRLGMIPFADYVEMSLGRNDLANSDTWQTLASNVLTFCGKVANAGSRCFIRTLLPSTTSTNGWLTASAQTVTTWESARLNYNTWVRNGAQVSAGSPVLTGGSPSPLVWNYFDADAVIEVNASNVLTIGGGFFQAPASATYTGQTLTGTPTATSLPVSTASYPVPSTTSQGLSGYTIQMTSGAANGQVAVISSNTATTLTVYANGDTSLTGNAVPGLTTTPAAGDTFSIYAAGTPDGIHGTPGLYRAISAAFATWLTANIVPYGQMIGN